MDNYPQARLMNLPLTVFVIVEFLPGVGLVVDLFALTLIEIITELNLAIGIIELCVCFIRVKRNCLFTSVNAELAIGCLVQSADNHPEYADGSERDKFPIHVFVSPFRVYYCCCMRLATSSTV